MDLDSYRNFLAIVEAGSLTGAADTVHVAQPALSKQLKNLENHFGAKLIITTRGSRKLLLTEAGRVLYKKAKYICSLDDLAQTEINNIMGGVRGTLRFSITHSRSAIFIKYALKQFCQLYPKINCELYEAGLEEQIQQLLSGITEIGVLSWPLQNQDDLEILFRRDEQMVAVFHKNSQWLDSVSSTDTVHIRELNEIPLSISSGCSKVYQKACSDLGLVPNILCICTSRTTAMQWVTEQAAVGLIPIEFDEDLGPDYVVKKVVGANANLFKSVVIVKDRPLSVAAQQFLKFYAKNRNSIQVCDLDEIFKTNSL